MTHKWAQFVQRYRLRHGLRQQEFAELLSVSQRTISRWERGEDQPSLQHQKVLRDVCCNEKSELMRALSNTIAYCPAPRALSLLPSLTLLAVSGAAIRKRPSVQNMIGEDLVHVACGVLGQVLDDRVLQSGIRRREVVGLECVTRGVLKTRERQIMDRYRTTITYFLHDGGLYSDAISAPAAKSERLGYFPIYADELVRSEV